MTYEGALWSLDDQGTAKLASVNADWLSYHRQNLIKDLGQLAHDTTSKFNNLLLLGMQDSDGNPVNAWYDSVADLVIQGGSNLNAEHNLVYLGLDNDEKQAWIFDDNDQRVYLQPLANNKNLVFDEKLMLTVLGDSAELFHPEQKYANVVRDGTNLRIETLSGAILQLPMNSDLTDKPTLIAFHVKEHEPTQILSELQTLTDDYELPPSVRLLAKSNQEPASWYITEEKKIICANGLEAEHFLHYLGKVVGLESWYIHDKNTGKLWSVNSDQSVVVGNYSFVHLEQDHLILEVSEITPLSLPQLQEASNLIISNKLSGQHHYLLNSSLLKHYQQIVINDQGTIDLDLESESTFSLQRSDKDIILHCDSFNTDILISNIDQAVQGEIILKVCDTQLPLNHLLTELDSSNNYLELTVSKDQLLVDEEFVNPYLSDSNYDTLDSTTTHDYSDLFYAQ
ncbi:hypothetical protein [Wolbachia endosymbiont of Frankliniella intonsa]|uniref:hypothetical protein n=1 Tax=Wolbachia endosymbiont of Frankliniella intonsa TaxID=2902422 RepID=UPI00244EB21A|nr:hypothetical protein [Wolbachia endosymbiont of Frankliniella intonsa]WGJ62510.1 hypothetical protein M3L71_02570 [Wolbachia endosymbiont of Frankliniella intonsa]